MLGLMIDAIYENGALKPLEALEAWYQVYEACVAEDIA